MDLVEIIGEAQAAAHEAARQEKFKWELAGKMDCCGFASVSIYKFQGKTIRTNSKIGKALIEMGIDKNYTKAYSWWNPSNINTQAITVKEKGAEAAAEVLKSYGFTAYAQSRMD